MSPYCESVWAALRIRGRPSRSRRLPLGKFLAAPIPNATGSHASKDEHHTGRVCSRRADLTRFVRYLWAVIPFGVVLILCVAILWPKTGWVFSMKTTDYTEGLPDGPPGKNREEIALETAVFLQTKEENDEKKLRPMFVWFQLAVVALLWEIVAWIVIIV